LEYKCIYAIVNVTIIIKDYNAIGLFFTLGRILTGKPLRQYTGSLIQTEGYVFSH